MWTAEDVEVRLREAYRTLRATPSADARFLHSGAGANWRLDVVDDSYVAYGYQRTSARPPAPSQEAITRMNEVLAWMASAFRPGALPSHLPPDTSKILWIRAGGLSWPRLIEIRARMHKVGGAGRGGGKSPIPGGNSHVSLKRIYDDGLAYLAEWLDERRIPVVLPRLED